MSLSHAHHGYAHQDVVAAYALASLLLPGTADREVEKGSGLSDVSINHDKYLYEDG